MKDLLSAIDATPQLTRTTLCNDPTSQDNEPMSTPISSLALWLTILQPLPGWCSALLHSRSISLILGNIQKSQRMTFQIFPILKYKLELFVENEEIF